MGALRVCEQMPVRLAWILDQDRSSASSTKAGRATESYRFDSSRTLRMSAAERD